MARDYYETLGVDRTADEREIKKAFRALARELHPDVNAHDPEAEEKFKEAADAYETLSDAERRQVYDRHGWDGLDSRGYASQAHGFGSFSDIFEAFFGALLPRRDAFRWVNVYELHDRWPAACAASSTKLSVAKDRKMHATMMATKTQKAWLRIRVASIAY